MNAEIEFVLKVLRNSLILAGLYFISVWASINELTFISCKPVLIFLFTYCLTEFSKRYGIDKPKEMTTRKPITTIIL